MRFSLNLLQDGVHQMTAGSKTVESWGAEVRDMMSHGEEEEGAEAEEEAEGCVGG